MALQRARSSTPHGHRSTESAAAYSGIIATIVVGCAFLIPVVIDARAYDSFRLPKVLLMRAAALFLAAAIGVSFARLRLRLEHFNSTVVLVCAGAAGATLLAAITSSYRRLSGEALLSLGVVIVFALAIAYVGHVSGSTIINALIAAGLVNSVVFLLQLTHVYTPFPLPPNTSATALLGTRDDVGSFLVPIALLAVCRAVLTDRRRVLALAIAIVLSIATMSSAVTSAIAFVAAVATLMARRSGAGRFKRLALVLIGAAVLASPVLFSRGRTIVQHLSAGDVGRATSNRVLPFVVAWNMFRTSPVLGIGPDVFHYRFFDYKIAAERDHPGLRASASRSYNFGEAHNDHLQILAETGILGYLVFGAAIVILARRSWTAVPVDGNSDQKAELARTMALPLAVAFAIEALAHFPLHLAASTFAFVAIGVLCVTWSSPKPAPLTERSTPRTAAAVLAAIGFVAAGVLTYQLAWRRLVCSEVENRAQVQTLATVNLPAYQAAPLAKRTLELVRPCLNRSDCNVNTKMIAAANQRVIGNYSAAIGLYESALADDRRPELFVNLGNTQLNAGNRREGLKNLVRAVAFDPEYITDVEDISARIEIEDVIRKEYPYIGPLRNFYW